jgi:signal transduction histidine kinase
MTVGLYWGALAALLIVTNILARGYDVAHPDQAVEVLFLMVAAAVLSVPEVRIERGRLTLNGIVSGATAILLNPIDASIASFGIAVGNASGSWRRLGNSLIFAAANCLGALLATQLRVGTSLSLPSRAAVLGVAIGANLAFTATAFAVRDRESPLRVLRHNLNASFLTAFAYFGLASILVSYVLDGSILGYFLATIVCVLALALTDTIAGRRVRRVLESELSDADRHLFHSRAVEGVVHNLRNHVATALAYLKEIDTRKLESPDRESLETATDAANDAVAVLRDLAQGATPKVSYAPNPVDLNELVTRAVGMARPRARGKEVQFAVHEAPTEVGVRADPLLMREVMTNLLNNAIDAVSIGGHVEVSTGRRNNGWPYVSVADNGPGVSDDNRHHLFEPHFTTKEGGTGLGLFMSYGIVREHQGQLTYEGGRRGAVFTVALPPFTS